MKPAYRVGDHVTFSWGRAPADGIVVEDSGEVGHARRRFYRVEASLDSLEPMIFFLAEDELTARPSNGRNSLRANAKAPRRRKHDQE